MWKVHGTHHSPDKVDLVNTDTIHFLDMVGTSLVSALALWDQLFGTFIPAADNGPRAVGVIAPDSFHPGAPGAAMPVASLPAYCQYRTHRNCYYRRHGQAHGKLPVPVDLTGCQSMQA
ncbi:MAG: hypothetical protein WBO57_01290 [Gammaproteobacteria bacterium]